MPHYTGIRIIFFQTFQQSLERFFLLQSSGILRTVTGIQSAFVADADAVGIVARGMRSNLIERSAGMNYPVARDVVVIAEIGEATGTMVTTAVIHGVTLRGTSSTTMNHNQVDATVVLVLATG